MAKQRHGGRLLADQLSIQGCERVFHVPGESFLPVLDGLYDHPDMDIVTCRQEGGAAMMAAAHGKLTGQPGVCMVTRGPGATNASAGVHVARHDSAPMLLLIGQVERAHRGRDAFQEVDLVAMFAPLCKWATEIHSAARIPEILNHAFRIALSGRPGPVVLSLPEDMLYEQAAVADMSPVHPAGIACSDADARAARELLASSKQPLVVVGGAPWDASASEALATFAERFQIPVTSAFRRQDYLHNEHPCYAGSLSVATDPALATRVREADLILALGTRLSEITTAGYTLLEPPVPRQQFIHVHADPAELGKVYAPSLAIAASPACFLAAMNRCTASAPPMRETWMRSARADYEADRLPRPMPGRCHLGEIVAHLNRTLPDDALITNGAGNYTAWVHKHTVYRGFPTQVAATSGSMGFGLPGAIAAKLCFPERPVVCWAGDGCYLMNGQELATAVQYGAALVVLVVNNRMYGTIRMHQERNFPGRVVGTALHNPDFVALAQSFGAFAARVTETKEFAPAFDEALHCKKPALIELSIDENASTPGKTLDEIRDASAHA